MSSEEILKRVEKFADESHGTQKRKYSDDRYIVHPVRVMNICRRFDQSLPVLAAALLHDVLEDTSVDEKEMKRFLDGIMNATDASRTMNLVIELTDTYTKTDFPSLNRRKRKAREAQRISETSAESQTIKYADIMDNCREITEKDPEFAEVFLRECRMLLGKMNRGNRELYGETAIVLEEAIKKLPRKGPQG